MQTEIREASAGDAETLAEIIKASFAEYEGRLDPPSSAQNKSAAKVRAELADGGALIYEQGGAPVGCVLFHPHRDHVYLDRLSVLPSFRRQGIAAALLQAVEARARALGLPSVRLSVRLALVENRAYYERAGYQFLSYGTHAGYSAPTYVTLEKHLP